VFDYGGARLGVLLSATPGQEAYISQGDQYTLVPDGLIVPMNHTTQPVYYTNNNCTGTPYAVPGHGYVANDDYVYIGFGNALYTASASLTGNLAVQSFSTGGGSCMSSSLGTQLHAMTSVGSPIDPVGSMPWHIVLQ
jgi:hypothetical protein